jgi:cephalosporin hydroxylase
MGISLRRRLGLGSPGLTIGKFPAPKGLRPLTAEEVAATDTFHRAYYDAWRSKRYTIDLSWFGHRTLKCPMDLWTYQEILVETRPDLVVECGTRFGGSAYFIASILDLLGHGRVLTIDIDTGPTRPSHPRIEYLTGSTADPDIVEQVRSAANGKRTMVILDSDHSRDHVLAELNAYREVVSVGCYLIVEDTDVNGHPARPDFGPGPMEALDAFLATTDAYVSDPDRERFMMTLNPRGFLKRVR